MSELPDMLSYSYGTSNTGDQNYLNIGHGRLDVFRNPWSNHSIIGPGNYPSENPNWPNPCNEMVLGTKQDCVIKGDEEVSERRLVKVMIVDPDLNVPVDNAVLVNEPEKITDLDDQELFFELDIKTILTNHNNYRTTLTDKKSKDNDTLEPIRIKDLKMMVLTIAEF